MSDSVKQWILVSFLVFLMLLTRGSHVLTSVSLPDASLAIFLIGGLLLRKMTWLVVFAALATVIDFTAAAVDNIQAFCITDGYWGMFPTYAVMWVAGLYLGKYSIALKRFLPVSLFATVIAFILSTQTYYLFSGRFPEAGLMESMQHGWEYLPSYLGYTMVYLLAFWMVMKALTVFSVRTNAKAI